MTEQEAKQLTPRELIYEGVRVNVEWKETMKNGIIRFHVVYEGVIIKVPYWQVELPLYDDDDLVPG